MDRDPQKQFEGRMILEVVAEKLHDDESRPMGKEGGE